MALQEEIKNFLLELGADEVGFCKLDKNYIQGQNLPYAVTILVKLPDCVLKTIENRPTIAYFHEYRTANALLDNLSFRLSRFIEKKGFNAFPIGASQSVPGVDNGYSGLFPHKTGACLSGLGFIGKSALFISSSYGSKVRLATVLTDAPLSAEREMVKNGCGGCTKCLENCPAGAISGKIYEIGIPRDEIFSAEKCSNYMKNFKDVGRGAVCGICIKVCPYNKLS